MRRRRGLSLYLCLLIPWLALALDAAQAAEQPPAPEGFKPPPPLRDLWSRSNERFLRQWLVLGPVAGNVNDDLLTAAGGEGSVRPTPGSPQALPGGATRPWLLFAAYQDTVNLAQAAGGREYRGSSAAAEVAYAYGVVNRAGDGDAVISLGSSGATRVWVNGALVHWKPATGPFSFDQQRVTVPFKRGENTLLVKSEHRSGPWVFALRLLEAGAVVAPLAEIVPAIVSSPPGRLAVRTDNDNRSQQSRVDVTVVAAGGRITAHTNAARGETATFATSKWPDGAYEIRLTTTSPWGEPFAAHLAWYKGDARAAAARLIETARSAPANLTGATVRMLSEYVLDQLGGSLENAVDDGWPAIYSPLMEFEELELAAAGKPGPIRPWGFVRLAYTDDVDGSTQYCRVTLPPDYSASRPSPTVIALHGYNPPNPPYRQWWNIAGRHNGIGERHNVIYIEPHGRGNAQYVGIGELDVLHCLDEAKRRLNIDADRVYLMGDSMGGSGTWIIASRHPELFAALAPIHGGWEYRLIPALGFDNPRATRPLERYTQEAQSSFLGAESLLNLPIWVHHGDQDQAVTVEFSRHVVRMLSRWGYDIRYDELPGRGHEELNIRDPSVAWMLTKHRNSAPRHVRVRSTDLGGASAYWVEVKQWQEPMRPIEVDAEAIEPGLIRLDTVNVASVRLAPPKEIRGRAAKLRVIWNGKESTPAEAADGSILLGDFNETSASLAKKRGIEGRLSSFFATPFAIVIGTSSSDPEMRRMCREKGEALAGLWNNWQHERPRVFTDNEFNAADEQKYSLLLIGGAEANGVTRRVIDRLPLKISRDSVTVDGRQFPATDAFVQMIYPNPAAPARSLLVVAATSTDGMYFWNPAVFWDQVFGFQNLNVDWNIVDGRRASFEPGFLHDRGWVASGVFDRSWRRDDRWVFLGDADLRARGVLRHAPRPGFKVATNVLDSYAGAYQLFPGAVATVTREGDDLKVTPPGAPAFVLIAETDSDFAVPATAAPLTFKRDAAGKVTEFVLDYNNQEYHATRLP